MSGGIAKYNYESGELEWITSGGSKYADVVFTFANIRQQGTYMTVNSSALTVYANFFGPATFSDTSIDCKYSGEAVWIRYDKETGEVLSLGHPTSLPITDQQ